MSVLSIHNSQKKQHTNQKISKFRKDLCKEHVKQTMGTYRETKMIKCRKQTVTQTDTNIKQTFHSYIVLR